MPLLAHLLKKCHLAGFLDHSWTAHTVFTAERKKMKPFEIDEGHLQTSWLCESQRLDKQENGHSKDSWKWMHHQNMEKVKLSKINPWAMKIAHFTLCGQQVSWGCTNTLSWGFASSCCQSGNKITVWSLYCDCDWWLLGNIFNVITWLTHQIYVDVVCPMHQIAVMTEFATNLVTLILFQAASCLTMTMGHAQPSQMLALIISWNVRTTTWIWLSHPQNHHPWSTRQGQWLSSAMKLFGTTSIQNKGLALPALGMTRPHRCWHCPSKSVQRWSTMVNQMNPLPICWELWGHWPQEVLNGQNMMSWHCPSNWCNPFIAMPHGPVPILAHLDFPYTPCAHLECSKPLNEQKLLLHTQISQLVSQFQWWDSQIHSQEGSNTPLKTSAFNGKESNVKSSPLLIIVVTSSWPCEMITGAVSTAASPLLPAIQTFSESFFHNWSLSDKRIRVTINTQDIHLCLLPSLHFQCRFTFFGGRLSPTAFYAPVPL